MQKRSLLFVTFLLALLLFILHYTGMTLYLYWTFWWYDYITHFLGGLVIGVLAMWVLNFEKRTLSSFLILFTSVMVVGGAWEIFEYVNGLTFSTQEYPIDTTIDFVMDALGAISAYFLFISRSRESF